MRLNFVRMLAVGSTVMGAVIATLLAVANPAAAHGDAHVQIAGLDKQITAQPSNAALVLRRAELHRIHQEFTAADKDYARVVELEARHPEVQWMRARSWHESGKATLALPELDRYLAQ